MTFGKSVRKSIATAATMVTPGEGERPALAPRRVRPRAPRPAPPRPRSSRPGSRRHRCRPGSRPGSPARAPRRPDPSCSASLRARSRMSPDRLERGEHRAVEGEQRQRDQAAEEGVRVEQVPEVADVLHVGVDLHAAHDVAEGHAPQQRPGSARSRRSRAPSCVCQCSSGRLARYSKATPRTIRQSRMSSSGR